MALGIALGVSLGPAAPAIAQSRTITVQSAEQLIAAIGSNRTIRVAPGSYQLDRVPRVNTKHVSWQRVHDGWQLIIDNVANLTIEGSRSNKPQLLVNARYAWVLRFKRARNVRLRDLILGHTPAGRCSGGVVAFARSKNVQVIRSELFGSGTVGVGLDKVSGFHMSQSTVRDCTYGIMTIKDSSRVRFSRSTFRDNREYDLIDITGTPNVRLDHCTVENNWTNRGGGYALFKLDNHSSIQLSGGSYRKNNIENFINRPRRMRLSGSASFQRDVRRRLQRIDPRFNQIYRVTRYRQWIVTGTQAGLVFWNTNTGQPDHVHKAFISNSLLVDGNHLWAGTYRTVLRFDGLRHKVYVRNSNARGHAVFRGPNGAMWARQGAQYWRYDAQRDQLTAARMPWLPGRAYAVATTPDRAVWSIDFMASIRRYHNGATKTYRLKSPEYPGRDPRSFHVAANGELWVSDFGTGFYRYDPNNDRFVRDPTVADKGAGIAVDTQNGRLWLGHYTRGVYLQRPLKPARFFAFPGLGYMRDLHADANGDLWVAGWNALVRLHRQSGTWKREQFVIQ